MTDLQPQTGFLDTQGAPLYYEVAGTGHPLLLIHAGVADSRMWDQQFQTFAQHYQVIRYDLRGFGQSSVPAGPFANHKDTFALLEHLGIKQAHVIGISFGGLVALDFTLAFPEKVTALVLGAPGVLLTRLTPQYASVSMRCNITLLPSPYPVKLSCFPWNRQPSLDSPRFICPRCSSSANTISPTSMNS